LAVAWIVAVAVAVQLSPFSGPLLLSSDAWTYWAYARLDNPYEDVPVDAPGDVSARWVGERWRDTTSVYGPAFTLASEPTAALDSADAAAWTFRALAALAMLVCVALAARVGAFATAFVGWNPLLALHAAGGGHNDAWVGALVLTALALGASGRRELAGLAWAVGTFVKWVPLVLLPLRALEARARRRAVGHLGFALGTLAIIAAATALYGAAWIEAFGPLARNAADTTSYSLANRLTQLSLPEPAALGIAATVFVVAYVWLARQALGGRARLALAACLLVACSPYVAPWYLAWVVPLAAVEDDRTARAFALALCAYLLPQTIPV
jgi:alpha-1,6-mannosyltransferase